MGLWPYIILQGLVASVCAIAAFLMYRRRGTVFNFPTLLLLNYMLTIPISGMIHFWPGIADRGYFDISATSGDAAAQTASLASAFGAGALILGTRMGGERARPHTVPSVSAKERVCIALVLAVVTPIAIHALLIVRNYARTSSQSRIIALDEGLARYSFASNWFVWVVSLLVLLTIVRLRSSLFAAVSTGVGAMIISSSLAWTGGRSIILVMVLPLVLIALPWLKGLRVPVIIAGLVLWGQYIVSVTALRAAQQQYDATGVRNWIDWQWGRFSMLGFAADYKDQHGLLWGETFLASIGRFLSGIAHLVGLEAETISSETVTQITGSQLLGSAQSQYIVPGLSAELYINFGMIGLFAGLYALGRATVHADRRFAVSGTISGKLFWAYVGTLLVLRTINAESGSFLSYFVFAGAPLIFLAAISSWMRDSSAGRRSAPTSEPKQMESSLMGARSPR
jgi:hypothetical protein